MSERIAEPRGKVADLVGPGWPSVTRFLHPAWRVAGDHLEPLTWSEVATATGRSVDLRGAAWHEVSGSRLHQPRPGAAYDTEPDVGPVAAVLVPVLHSLARSDDPVVLAEWDGWDAEGSGRSLPGAELAAPQVLVGLPHTVWRTTAGTAARLLQQDLVRADWTADPGGRWVLVCSPDLASTYAATRTHPPEWPPHLEHTPVHDEDLLG